MSMTNRQALNKLLEMLTTYPFKAGEALAIGRALESLNAPTREQVERMRGEWIPFGGGYIDRMKCSCCGWSGPEYIQIFSWCPACGAPMTDEAVQMVMERMEVLYEAT